MKVSFEWLKDYVDIKLKPEELAEKLTMAGLEVTSLEKTGGDAIMELEITPNRPDCLSVIGIAREVSAVTGKKLKLPKTALKVNSKIMPKVEIKDKALCPRYTARIIEGVKVGPSPSWLVEKLEKMGLRPVNNVVDITNFCLFEYGQPLHAFDYDKFKGAKVVVRRARQDEKIMTIDGNERVLSKDALIIADDEGPVAIGGVMGSSNSEVTEFTKNILLESAYFDPISVRRTSRRLGLISESSYRFERSVDLDGVVRTSDRASALILQLCGGRASSLKDVGKSTSKKKEIQLRLSRLNTILGQEITAAMVKKIFTSLDLKVKPGSKGKIKVAVPHFRQDLKDEVDLLEEVARIYGYDKFHSTIPPMVDQTQKRGFDFERCERRNHVNDVIRETLVSSGLNEIITYSLMSRSLPAGIKGVDKSGIVAIRNPLSSEQEIMRPTLLPGLLGVVSRNLNRRVRDQKLFELGKVYSKDKHTFVEEESLSIGLTGLASGFWLIKKKIDLFYLKGVVESLFEKLGITDFSVDTEKIFPSTEDTAIKIGNKEVGFLQKAPKDLLARFDIKTDVVVCEIKIPALAEFIKLQKKFSDIAKYPSAIRDLSLIVDESVLREKVAAVIKSTGGKLVKKTDFFDQYRGQQIPAGKKGLSYSIEYQAEDRTLTDKEINKLHNEICAALATQLGAQVR